MICLFCEHETSNPKFCDASCSAKYNNGKRKPRTFESRLKTSQSCARGNTLKYCKTCDSEFYSFQSKRRKYCSLKCSGQGLKNIFEADFSLNGKGNHKRVLIHERGHRCERCKLEVWLEQPISLQLEHKDGNHNNNAKENLELLCPNCHSQTSTYNRRKTAVFITDEEFLLALQTTKTIHQCIRKLGLNTSSANYSRAKRLLKV
jgi:hypothetical protein